MINLLPQYWQKKLDNEELFRVVAILGIVAVAALLSFVMMLFLIKSYFEGDLKVQDIVALEKNQEIIDFKVAEAEQKMADFDKFITKLKKIYDNQTKVTEIFSQVTKSLPKGIILTDFNYALGKINLSGVSLDQETLVALKENLVGNKNFKDIVLPLDSLLVSDNINFNVSFDYEFKE
jgi:Tfp pilus assembly protein PilN